MTTRRIFLSGMGLGLGALAFRGPSLSFAKSSSPRRLVVVNLRGGADGLGIVAPFGDPDYQRARGALALSPPGSEGGLIDIDGFFGLHPALVALEPMLHRGEVLPVHAVATPYRERSHFDAQNLLECGTTRAHARKDGWLGRALAGVGSPPEAVALGQVVPLILQGRDGVRTVTAQPGKLQDGILTDTLADMYADDPLFGPTLEEGLSARTMVSKILEADDEGGSGGRKRRKRKRRNSGSAVEIVGSVLAQPQGPQVAVVEVGGWDTHARQGTTQGGFARRLKTLGAGLSRLRTKLGPVWEDTVVLVVTEFGRTVAPNGTAGTDHGTASCALLLGGAVAGGRVVADWPGLAKRSLYEGRDLRPTTDLRSVAKGLLRDHLGLGSSALDAAFPNSASARPLPNLVRST